VTLQEIKIAVEEAKKRCRGAHVKVVEESIGGEVIFVELTARFKVEKVKKTLDSCKQMDIVDLSCVRTGKPAVR